MWPYAFRRWDGEERGLYSPLPPYASFEVGPGLGPHRIWLVGATSPPQATCGFPLLRSMPIVTHGLFFLNLAKPRVLPSITPPPPPPGLTRPAVSLRLPVIP